MVWSGEARHYHGTRHGHDMSRPVRKHEHAHLRTQEAQERAGMAMDSPGSAVGTESEASSYARFRGIEG